MFQEHCTRAHIECKLRLNNSFVSDFRRNSRALPQPRYQFSLFLLPLSNGAFFTENVLRLMGFFFFFFHILKFTGRESRVENNIWNNIDMYVSSMHNFCESDYTVNADIFFFFFSLKTEYRKYMTTLKTTK